MNVEHIVGDVEDHRLREELSSCELFLVDSELERARYKVFNYALETVNKTIVNRKLDRFFINLKCAAKVTLAFFVISKNVEDGGFRFFSAHENNTLLDRSKLCAPMTIWQSRKFFSTKLTSYSLVAKKERTESGGSTKWRT